MQIQFFAAFIANLLHASSMPNTAHTAILTVRVSNIAHHEGHIKAVLFDRSNFLTEKFVACIEISANESKGVVQTSFQGITPGDYAVAIYQDLNDNDWFDRNWIGYPKEPFAMSNNLHPLNMLYPDFEDAKVHLDATVTMNLDIKLLNN